MLGVAIHEERVQHSWTEGVAIWVAVIVVSGVGEHTCLESYANSLLLLQPERQDLHVQSAH